MKEFGVVTTEIEKGFANHGCHRRASDFEIVDVCAATGPTPLINPRIALRTSGSKNALFVKRRLIAKAQI